MCVAAQWRQREGKHSIITRNMSSGITLKSYVASLLFAEDRVLVLNASTCTSAIGGGATYMQPCTMKRGVNWTVDCFLLHQVVLSGHNKAVDALAFSSPSPSSSTLLCSASADAILLWNLDKLEPSAGNISRGGTHRS